LHALIGGPWSKLCDGWPRGARHRSRRCWRSASTLDIAWNRWSRKSDKLANGRTAIRRDAEDRWDQVSEYCAPIIDRQRWETVQRRLADDRVEYARTGNAPDGRQYVLSGLLTCLQCPRDRRSPKRPAVLPMLDPCGLDVQAGPLGRPPCTRSDRPPLASRGSLCSCRIVYPARPLVLLSGRAG
jgi:hypothetical protein